MGLDGVVPESTNRVQGQLAAEGGSAIGKAAGADVKKSDVFADPPKGRKKTPTVVVVPISNVPGAVVVGKKSDVPPDPKAWTTPAAEGGCPGRSAWSVGWGKVGCRSEGSEAARCGWDCRVWGGDQCSGWREDSRSDGVG